MADINEFQPEHTSQSEDEDICDSSCDEDGDNDENTDADKKKKKKRVISKSSKMLQYIKKHKLEATFPNVEVALRILESIPVSNASGERSFSSLKHIKPFARNCLTQENLNDLSTLFMNRDILNSMNFDKIIDTFASLKARKKVF